MNFTFLLLLLLAKLFALRVVGQMVVARYHPTWLPPMHAWYSGLLSYPRLVVAQVIILATMAVILAQFWMGRGYFVDAKPGMGRSMVAWACVYVAAMVVRYVVRMWRPPDQRWLGGTIPIIFHCVLAAFLGVLGWFHASQG